MNIIKKEEVIKQQYYRPPPSSKCYVFNGKRDEEGNVKHNCENANENNSEYLKKKLEMGFLEDT